MIIWGKGEGWTYSLCRLHPSEVIQFWQCHPDTVVVTHFLLQGLAYYSAFINRKLRSVSRVAVICCCVVKKIKRRILPIGLLSDMSFTLIILYCDEWLLNGRNTTVTPEITNISINNVGTINEMWVSVKISVIVQLIMA